MTNKEKFISWFNEEKKKGLVYIHFSKKDIAVATVESFFEEINNMINAEEVEDKELS